MVSTQDLRNKKEKKGDKYKMTTLTNQEVYSLVQGIGELENTILLPARVNFALQCNVKKLAEIAEQIEKSRIDIGKKYGGLSADGTSYNIKPDLLDKANEEILDLFSYENKINIKKVGIDKFDDVDLTLKQMNILMFMINEEEEA